VIDCVEVARRLWIGLVLTGVFGVAGLVVSAVEAVAGKTVWRVELDGDERLETVRIKTRRCDEPRSCTQLVLRDGRRRVKLTPISQRPNHPWHWDVTKVRFRDLTGDGLQEIMWDLFTVGGTGSSPSLKGVHRWDGREASRIFQFANGRRPPPGYAHVVAVSWRIVKGAGALPEIETTESLHKRDDATCCPSAYRVTRHRWNGSRIAPVAGSQEVEPASAAGRASAGRVYR
jgi:hypothetical protein